MKTFIITYRSCTDHDCCKVWCNAESKSQAEDHVRGEYWDIEEILGIREM